MSNSNKDAGYLAPGKAWYLVFVLLVIYIISFVDRQILSLLVKPIRAAMEISDSQTGLLMGFGFALFYTLFGIPLGILADRMNRMALIAVGLVLWSVMTAGCGFANTYYSLLFFRFGVGIGEAALSPAAYSMIADAFPARRLSTAISVYSMGVYLGSGLAMLFGGLIVKFAMTASGQVWPVLGQAQPWQLVFVVVGLAGLPLVLLLLTVREPARHKASGGSTFGETIAYLRKHAAAFLLHSTGFGMLALVGYANMYWVPQFFLRLYKWEAPQTAWYYGIAILIFGTVGIVAGGWLGDSFRSRGKAHGSMLTCLISAALALPFGIAYPLAGAAMLSMGLVAGLTFTTSLASGAAPSAIQQMMPPAMRGQASALYLFIVNIFGMGIGPYAVGALNTYVFGDDHIHHSLVVVSVTGCIGGMLLLALGLRPFERAAREVDTLLSRAAGI